MEEVREAIEFGSVCSGIEAASVAWGPLGWRAAWLSEIDRFASSVLAHRIPHAPNLGDMTTLPERIRAREVKAPPVFTGGTPCQAFSVAGKREGLADARGNLTMTFVEIANAIDDVRRDDGEPAAVIVWENVPGVLSSADNAFGCFLGALSGAGCELQPAGKRWSDAGCVYGPRRAIAWRTIDAQFFGVAQRRRRVFVVASARDDGDPAAVLFESEGMRRDSPPSRETGEDTTVCPTLRAGGNRTGGDRHPGTDVDTADSLQVVAFSCKDHGGDVADVAPTLRAIGHGASHANAGGQVAVAFQVSQSGSRIGEIHAMLDANNGSRRHNGVLQPVAFHPLQDPIVSMDGTTHAVGCGSSSGQASIAVAVTGDVTHALNTANNGKGCSEDGTWRGVPTVAQAMAVRRLTPRECERLQGFEDDWTLIPVKERKKLTADEFAYLRRTYPKMTAEEAYRMAKDGPRYKAIGNSWAVPCAAWVGARVDSTYFKGGRR